jgi:NNP family nitrate/nitrite transporter-like MFS transporter
MFGVSYLPAFSIVMIMLFVGMGCLGMGNGAVFQIIPQRFREEIGMVTGLVGAAGGIGGFFVPNLLGSLKQITGTYASGFIGYSLMGLAALIVLLTAVQTWKKTFLVQSNKVEA